MMKKFVLKLSSLLGCLLMLTLLATLPCRTARAALGEGYSVVCGQSPSGQPIQCDLSTHRCYLCKVTIRNGLAKSVRNVCLSVMMNSQTDLHYLSPTLFKRFIYICGRSNKGKKMPFFEYGILILMNRSMKAKTTPRQWFHPRLFPRHVPWTSSENSAGTAPP